MKLNRRDKAIIASIHMRSAIKGLGGNFASLSSIIHIDLRCYKGEMKFYKANPFQYDYLQKVCKITSELYDKKYSGTAIATDTFLDCLYHDNQHEFKNYFKLKTTMFGRLFQQFGEDDECEKQTIEAGEFITNCIDKAEEIYKWRLWIKSNQRSYNENLCISSTRDNSHADSLYQTA